MNNKIKKQIVFTNFIQQLSLIVKRVKEYR